MREAFDRAFGHSPAVAASAPGRVNLIGDHTDYAEGFCLPMPLPLETHVALAPAASFRARSEAMAATLAFDPYGPPRGDWTDYIAGPLAELAKTGFEVPPVEILVRSSVPAGAGLSSSAALEVATLRAVLALTGQRLSDGEIARLAQAGENNYCGVQCGILDQMASAAGRRGHALLLDCRTNTGRRVPVPSAFHFNIVHCGAPRRLVDGAYNARRKATADAARHLGLPMLRDADASGLAALTDGEMLKRARHVVTENARVLAAVAALEAADLHSFGALMNESHASLAGDFDVSTPALDRLVESARRAGAIGARLTGAGFGGCIVALVPAGLPEWWPGVAAANPHAWLV
ncbi:MAG: galactokinase [Parvibaculum sp.]|uniref:galactokinase n=1 Tax=Parvibaculum sp. TaxID=2024848 RepID=UPI002727AE79|nr:galactokinase [Parvibaculum sp.]MDO8838134.1 galactokinase [Parvibaculum sp.]